MSDLISRQVVLAMQYRIDDSATLSTRDVVNVEDIEDLPSAKAEPCEDAISRQAVLEKAVYTETEEGWSGYSVDVKDIEALPSVNPQPKTGHWITDGAEDGYVECPFCHSLTNCENGNYDDLHFCFSCGADMREDKDAQ